MTQNLTVNTYLTTDDTFGTNSWVSLQYQIPNYKCRRILRPGTVRERLQDSLEGLRDRLAKERGEGATHRRFLLAQIERSVSKGGGVSGPATGLAPALDPPPGQPIGAFAWADDDGCLESLHHRS